MIPRCHDISGWQNAAQRRGGGPIYRRAGGMTLVELLMALSIMALISTAVGAMLTATAYGTDADQDIRGLTVRAKAATMRLNAALRGSRSVLHYGAHATGGWVVFWTRDTDGDGLPSLYELRRIEFDGLTQTLTSYAPADDADNRFYSQTTDFSAETRARIDAGDMVGRPWIDGLVGVDVRFDTADYRAARLMTYRLTIRVNGVSETLAGTVWLRNGEDGS